MRTKNRNPASLLEQNVGPMIRLYFEINHLKQLYRQGWLKAGREIPVENCETVAEHVFGMAILALFVCDSMYPNLDKNKVVTMTLIHELGEVRDGDKFVRTPEEKKSRYDAERIAIAELLAAFPERDKYMQLWEEFERGDTAEARLVRELDKLEMVLQAKIYSLQHKKNLQEFFDSAREHFTSSKVKGLFREIESL